MKALSVRQPWAWLIANGHKNVENRTWPTHFKGRVLIHAGKTMTRADYEACEIFLAGLYTAVQLPPYDELRKQCGGIVGETEIVSCVTSSTSEWFTGDYGYVLRNSKPLPFRPCSGMLGFFEVQEVAK